ncbi:MAG TPA: hypothetical protein VL126_03385 [Bacteroidota bacterium]|nr:hypothetical protein [Bacteroidota bacterium]
MTHNTGHDELTAYQKTILKSHGEIRDIPPALPYLRSFLEWTWPEGKEMERAPALTATPPRFGSRT